MAASPCCAAAAALRRKEKFARENTKKEKPLLGIAATTVAAHGAAPVVPHRENPILRPAILSSPKITSAHPQTHTTQPFVGAPPPPGCCISQPLPAPDSSIRPYQYYTPPANTSFTPACGSPAASLSARRYLRRRDAVTRPLLCESATCGGYLPVNTREMGQRLCKTATPSSPAASVFQYPQTPPMPRVSVLLLPSSPCHDLRHHHVPRALNHVFVLLVAMAMHWVRRASCVPGSAQLSDEPHHRQSYTQNKKKGPTLLLPRWCVQEKKESQVFSPGHRPRNLPYRYAHRLLRCY